MITESSYPTGAGPLPIRSYAIEVPSFDVTWLTSLLLSYGPGMMKTSSRPIRSPGTKPFPLKWPEEPLRDFLEGEDDETDTHILERAGHLS